MMKGFKKNLGTIIFAVFMLLIVFVPSAKAMLLRGLSQVDLFKPTIKTEQLALDNNLDLHFKDQKGNILTLKQLKGKVVFLNFWATWCLPCLAEMPSINKLHRKYKDNKDVVFIMLDTDSNFEKAGAYMKRKNYTMPVYQMVSNVPEQVFSGALPTTIVFDKEGRLSFKHEGFAKYNSQTFIDFIDKLIASKKQH